MKKSFTRPVLFFIILFLGFSSCTKDSGSDPDPSDARSRFTGNWSVSETVTKLTYEVNIRIDGGSADGVIISNFGASGADAQAYVSGDVITLPNQTIGSGWVVYGSGTLSGSTKITWLYTINDGADLRNIVGIYTKI
jgi:hypothetical protein